MSSASTVRDALTIDGPAGRIELLLDAPGGAPAAAVAVVCHPHPQHQGTMLNKVVHTLARAMNDLSVPAVRFNFRGVGASEGAYADGIGEVDDLAAVADWTRHRFPGAELWLAGFSFGAAVAINAAQDLRARRLVSVAPPVARMAPLLERRQPACWWLVIQGTADDVVSSDDVREWVARQVPAPELVLLDGVDHFFHGRLGILRSTLVERLGEAHQA